jgi:hypothetical protein
MVLVAGTVTAPKLVTVVKGCGISTITVPVSPGLCGPLVVLVEAETLP